ncbi:reverse transcriptase domain-containing protein [Tanacetum coccineum]
MADNRTMAQMLQAPIEGYEDAIVVPPINANNFKLKQTLINLVQSNQFTGEARTWLDKEPPRSILTWDDLVSKFINQFFPPSKTTYLRNEITTFYQKPNETFNEAWERFKGLLRQCPHHGFSELHQLDTFYNSLNTNDQDALDSAAGGNFLDKMPRDGLAIIESKSKVRYSRSRAIEPRVSTNAPLSTSTPSNSFEIQQLAASLEDKMDIRMSRLEKMISEKNVTTPATVKAVEEVCVTCGSNHNFNNCPLTRNDFPVFHDNIHQFQQTAAVGNFVQRNPPNLANQMRPPGFNQPNVQNNQGNQSRYQGNNFNSNQNRGNNFNQKPQQTRLSFHHQPITTVLPISTISRLLRLPNPRVFQKQNLKTTSRQTESVLKNLPKSKSNYKIKCQCYGSVDKSWSGKTLEGPSNPLVPTPVISNPQKDPKQNPETSTEKVQNPNLENTTQVPPPKEEDSIFMEIPKPKAKKTVNVETQDLNSPKPTSYQSKLPYPERMKVRENDKPKKLEEIAITTVNAECSAIIMNKVPEKLEDPRKFLIPCALQELDRTSALADSGASINILPHSIYKQLGLEALTPTRMTLELANHDPFSGSTTIPSNAPFPSSSLMKTSDNFERFADELAPLDSLPPEKDKDVEIKSFSFPTLTSPEESELILEEIEETDLIPPGIDLTLCDNHGLIRLECASRF